MRKLALSGVILSGAALVAAPAFAQDNCTRDSLQDAADSYVAAQSAGDRTQMSMGHGYRYLENRTPVDIDDGLLAEALSIDYVNGLLDEEECAAFVEMVVLDPAHPYVIGTRLNVGDDGLIQEIEAVVTDADDWLFDAAGFHDAVKDEDWGEIPEGDRDTRQTLIDAATAYYDRFEDPSVVVPFGEQCYRVEGGARTDASADAPANSCPLGMPEEPGQLQLVERSFLADPALGAVVGFSLFGATGGEPDIHLFRVENGGIRYVHAMTACSDNGCDFGTGSALGPGAGPD